MKKELIFTMVPVFSEYYMQRLLDDFEAQTFIHVTLNLVPWKLYRQEFLNIALHRVPADVGLTGMPATSDLIAMNALRPFSAMEVNRLGGADAYLPSRWRSGIRPGSSEVWAVPLIADPRLLYYRHDYLLRAGVKDPAAAFANPQVMRQTFQALHEAGIAPWLVVMSDRFNALHRAVSFIWARGGDLFSPDGKRVIFHEPEALDGLRDFFTLAKLAPSDRVNQDVVATFVNGEVATTVSNAFGLYHSLPAEVGCVALPGGSYVGGSDLMIWGHSHNQSAAMELVCYLSQQDVLREAMNAAQSYLLPRISELDRLAARPDPIAGQLVHATKAGRSFPCVPMIGLTEDRLGLAVQSILQELFSNPAADLEELLQQQVVLLGKRTNISLDSLR